MSSRLIVFACFLNEQRMLPHSLEQLDRMPAQEVHIADGCFDRKYSEHSGDGSYEILREFAAERDHVFLHRVARKSKTQNILSWIRYLLFPPRLQKLAFAPTVAGLFRTNNYRLNQAATFNRMLRLSSAGNSDWVMTYDADEYFDDGAFAAFAELHRFADVVPIRERTFVGDLKHEALRYPTTELRYWNIPHRVRPHMRFVPPRLIVWPVRGSWRKFRPYRLASAPTSGSPPVGTLFHYKCFDPVRSEDAYRLGDRKPPDAYRMDTTKVEVIHPVIPARAFAELQDENPDED